MAASALDPTALRRKLRNELREARNSAGLTQRDIADRLEWSTSKIIRIESGQVAVSTVDLRALLQQYGIRDEVRVEELVELARSSKKQPWSQYKDILPQEALDYFGYEASAYIVRQYEPQLVPGLLQTEEYALEVLMAGYRNAPDIAERKAEARKVRQELLDRADHPQLFFILDEAVIRRIVGGPEVMGRQLDHLVQLAKRDAVTIQIYPFSAGAYQGMAGPFAHLELPGDEGDALFLEGRTDAVIRDDKDDRAEVARHLEIFQTLENNATSEEEFVRLVQSVKASW